MFILNTRLILIKVSLAMSEQTPTFKLVLGMYMMATVYNVQSAHLVDK